MATDRLPSGASVDSDWATFVDRLVIPLVSMLNGVPPLPAPLAALVGVGLGVNVIVGVIVVVSVVLGVAVIDVDTGVLVYMTYRVGLGKSMVGNDSVANRIRLPHGVPRLLLPFWKI